MDQIDYGLIAEPEFYNKAGLWRLKFDNFRQKVIAIEGTTHLEEENFCTFTTLPKVVSS